MGAEGVPKLKLKPKPKREFRGRITNLRKEEGEAVAILGRIDLRKEDVSNHQTISDLRFEAITNPARGRGKDVHDVQLPRWWNILIKNLFFLEIYLLGALIMYSALLVQSRMMLLLQKALPWMDSSSLFIH
ncbi:hypothetical protein NE237_013738 [Protea cynaroides]|uniref:Uncharacterized protein n=1 Tax=Protea cynaroides TaxID=273540 RepID=A0A9Q0H0G8_9MAGN|nr:hypothetical protein NE237_013738 [Protea cynaroides]